MKRWRGLVPVACFLIALAMLIAGFGLMATEPPGPESALHRARAAGDDRTVAAYELTLQRRQSSRIWLIGGLFAGSLLWTGLAFASMSNSGRLTPEQPTGGATKPGTD